MNDILSTAIIIQICIHELLVRILFKISRETLICAPRTRSIHEGRPVFAPLFVRKKAEKRARDRGASLQSRASVRSLLRAKSFQTKRRLLERYSRIFIISFGLPRAFVALQCASHLAMLNFSFLNPLEFSLRDTPRIPSNRNYKL